MLKQTDWLGKARKPLRTRIGTKRLNYFVKPPQWTISTRMKSRLVINACEMQRRPTSRPEPKTGLARKATQLRKHLRGGQRRSPSLRTAHLQRPACPRESVEARGMAHDYVSVAEGMPSGSSSVFSGDANRLFRRLAGRGARVMVMLRPVIFGSISTCDMPERSSRTFSTSCIPNS